MAGWDDSIFGNLPGAPPRPQPPPARGLRKELAPVNPMDVVGGLQHQYAEAVGNAAAYMAGHPAPLPSTSYWVQPESVLESANRFGRDITARIEQPGEGVKPSHAIEAAPLAIPAAKAIASGTEEAAQAAKPPIIAYHGSPASFDKFDPSKIGTGEGAQVYGHGFYFAENEDVAKNYRDQLAKGFVDKQGNPLSGATQNALEYVSPKFKASGDLSGGVQDAISRLQDQADFYRKTYGGGGSNLYDSAVERLKAIDLGNIKPAGHMYQVGINADPEKFLDWDKPLSEQSEPVMQAMRNAGVPEEYLKSKVLTGEKFAPQNADYANELAQAGIPGVRYLDQGSRGAGGGTSNYVVFDPDTVKILKQYGLAGMLAPVGAGAATLSVLGQPGSGMTLNSNQPPPDPQQQQPQFY